MDLPTRLEIRALNMEKYEAFLFDWDGTAARTLEVWLELMRGCFEDYGMTELTDTEVASTFGRMEAACKELGFPMEKFADFEKLVKKRAVVKIPNAPLYDGVQELWEYLHNQGKKLAIITANHREVIDSILAAHVSRDLFELVVAGDEVKSHKPDPEGIEFAIEKLGVKKSKAVMLGDSPHDIGAANNAGVDSVLYYPAGHVLFHDFEKLKRLQPTHIISNWEALLNAD